MEDNGKITIVVALISVIGIIIASLLGASGEIAKVSSPQGFGAIIGIGIGLVIIVGIIAYFIYRDINKQNQKARERIAQAESKVEDQPEKARPAWDLARVTLEAYFNRNLSQITYIFWLSVSVMVVGFGIIVWGITQSIQMPNSLAPASLSILAGVITEFIGATFLFIYRSTIQQAINYSKTLERINSVGMAMQILDTMPDNAKISDLKSKTKANLVELLVTQVPKTSEIDKTEKASES